ncbi:BadF/BadG/BcrA/BcrD ATPase family protein [Bacillus sp. FJAT-50079]|uniref:N-acetylglucosamine kinase n=1 Tax=Bacillus sp. FJAT-50079 TaxID=2833577 RepID=UPI001BC9E902|nr:BadF/BadG/BcrA/BcrD ATPase family protein [Bacillus sp. FJAT-50079]MBS4207910.1 hypothetical protein [Bacillus sp. FJAT-50079]
MYVLAIDGGGTKTKGVIANENGDIIAEVTVGASNPNSVGKDDLRNELTTLFSKLKEQSNMSIFQISRVFAGMSGVEHPTARKEMQILLSSIIADRIPITVNNDAITALYSGTFGEPGIVQIAGTGSITYGINKKGELDRVGGWGYLLGEKGSGYALGSQGLDAAFSAYDKLGEETMLVNQIIDHFQVRALPNIIQPVYQAKNQKEIIASISKLVVAAADQGDPVSLAIIRQNALYLGESISCLIKKLFTDKWNEEQIQVVLTGGLFNRLDLLQHTMREVFQKNHIQAELIIPKVEPVIGAVVAGLIEEGIGISQIKQNFKA